MELVLNETEDTVLNSSISLDLIFKVNKPSLFSQYMSTKLAITETNTGYHF